MAQPKMDFKMLVLPAVLLLSRRIDMKPESPDGARNILLAQQVLVAVAVLMVTLYAYLYVRINAQKEKDKAIWVPPKAKPQLPFGLGPAEEPPKESEYEETTYKTYEMKMLQEAAGGLLFSVAVTLFMSFKFKVHISLLIQGITLPLNAIDLPLVKKYLWGIKRKDNGVNNMYNEMFVKPTAETLGKLASIMKQASTGAKGNTGSVPASSSTGPCLPDEPRVVELSESTSAPSSSSKATPASSSSPSSAAGIDDVAETTSAGNSGLAVIDE
jgi:Phosphate transport (Pho88)